MSWSCQDGDLRENLSVPPRNLGVMSNRTSNKNPKQISNRNSNRNSNDTATTQLIFANPVRYLAGLGLTAEIVAETALPAAA
jgi:hypothetical protein